MEKLSVIVPVYNVKEYLRECLDSIVTQTYGNLEIILIDDGSTDSSGKICDEYAKKDQRIIVIHQDNMSLSVARNTGLKKARGSYIAFVDSDDTLQPDMYEKMLARLKETDSDLVISRFNKIIDGRKVVVDPEKYKDYEQKSFLPIDFFGNIMLFRFMVWNKLFKAEKLKNLEFVPKQVHQDIHYESRAILRCTRIAFISEGLYNYRENRPGASNSQRFKPSRLCFTEEFPWILEQLSDYKSDKRYLTFLKYCLRYHINEYMLAVNLHGTEADRQRIIQSYRAMEKEYRSLISLCGEKYEMPRLFLHSPDFYVSYKKMKTSIGVKLRK